MPQPTPYDRQFNFQNQQAQTPTDPLPADDLDAELNAIKITLDGLLANLALIQRDDGEVANETIGEDQLKPELALYGEPLAAIQEAVDSAAVDAAAADEAAAQAEAAQAAAEAAQALAETAKLDAQSARNDAQTAQALAEAASWDPTAADKFLYSTGVSAKAEAGITAAGRAMAAAADAAAQTALLDAFVGDSGSGGTKGLVPAPAAGDAAAGKFLKADGTFAAPSGAGAVLYTSQSLSASEKDQALANLGISALVSLPHGRLTLTTATPVTTSDVTAATTLYYALYIGNRIALYNGSVWVGFSFSELSISLSGLTADTNYDVFCYDNSGTPTLELTAWSSATARATALVRQDGVWVKSGATTRRYLGTIRITGTTGQTEDSNAKRYVWNAYNQVRRNLLYQESGTNWNYTTATWRAYNNGTNNPYFRYVSGLGENPVRVLVHGLGGNSSGGQIAVGVGIDSPSSNSAQLMSGSANTGFLPMMSQYFGYPGIGYHQINMLEISQAVGTTTFYGTNGLTYERAGMTGEIWA